MKLNLTEQFVEFNIGMDKYAVVISEVHEIIQMLDITGMPDTPMYVRGVVNLRGNIVPVVSLRLLLGMPEEAMSKSTRIIVVRNQETTLGIIVDKVTKVIRFKNIQAPPDRFGGISSLLLSGIGINDGELTGILKLKEVLMQ